MATKIMNKLQKWVCSYIVNRLEQLSEVVGVQYLKVNPAYISQTCGKCGILDKKSKTRDNISKDYYLCCLLSHSLNIIFLLHSIVQKDKQNTASVNKMAKNSLILSKKVKHI